MLWDWVDYALELGTHCFVAGYTMLCDWVHYALGLGILCFGSIQHQEHHDLMLKDIMI